MGYQEKMDDLDDYPVGVRIRILAAQIKASANLSTWVFINDGSMFFSTSVHEKEFLSFFKLGKCLDFLYESKKSWEKPVILSDPLGMIWLAENAYEMDEQAKKNGESIGKEEDDAGMLVVIGPLFLSRTSVKQIEESLRLSSYSVHMRREMMRTLAEVPVIAMSAVNQYAKMMHYTVASKPIQTSDFIFQNEETRLLTMGEEIESSVEYQSLDRIVQEEKLILQAVQDGNLDYQQIVEESSNFQAEMPSNTRDVLRDGKNSVLIFTALCSRAAMEGGLAVKTAKEMELRYISEIENCETITKLKNLKNNMLDEFVHKVRESKENPMISKTIQECCDYIRTNVLRPLTVEDIAKEMGYTTYYFTKKFYKEMGIKVTDYIKQARIEYAKIALLSTKKSIQEISDSLQFGTRNYFSKVFREIVGVTPAAYREKVGKGDDKP